MHRFSCADLPDHILVLKNTFSLSSIDGFIYFYVCVCPSCVSCYSFIHLKSTDTIMKNKNSNKQQNQRNPRISGNFVLCFARVHYIFPSSSSLQQSLQLQNSAPSVSFFFVFVWGMFAGNFFCSSAPSCSSPLCVFHHKCIIEQQELTESNDIPNATRKQLQHLLYEFSLVFV